MDVPAPPATAYDRLDDALTASDADAFVHVGDRFDDLLRYLTRFGGPDRDYAFAYAAGRAHLCAPSLFVEQARREFPGDAVHAAADQSATSPAERALEALDGSADDGRDTAERILVPPSVPADAYRTLAAAADEVVVEPVDVGRERKTDAERACHECVQHTAQRGMARAEAVLAAAEVGGSDTGDHLRWEGQRLTTERLRREVNAVLSAHGVRDAGNTVVGAGETCADLHYTGTDAIRSGETVLLDISPRGPHGYYGDLTRTFVVGEVGEWERTAYDAVSAAQDAALDVLESGAGTRAGRVHEAATDALADRGFASGAVDVGMYHGVGHGVGVSLHESPSLTGDAPLEPGNVVTVEPGVYDPSVGGVRIEDLVIVTEAGYENLTDYPRSVVPRSVVSDAERDN
jgi:Xaa-Pro aminopeptidase